MAEPGKIVVRGPNWIGDQVMALPFYRELRATYPSSHLTLLCPPTVASVPTDTLFDETIRIDHALRRTARGVWLLSRQLAGGNFDLSISLPASFGSALPFFLARIPNRVGFDSDGSGVLLTDSLRWQGVLAREHKSRLYLDLISFLRGHTVPFLPFPSVRPSPKRERQIIIAPGASISLRVWPYFEKLIVALREAHPELRLIAVGSEAEKGWHPFLSTYRSENLVDRIGTTTLEQLRDLCAGSVLVVANDSGVAHIAGTLAATPTLVLFGPGDPNYIRPLGPFVHGIAPTGLACSPCESSHCRAPFGYQRCLRDISVSDVMQGINDLLGKSG